VQRALKRPPRSLMTLGGELSRSHFQAGPKREPGSLAKAVLAARLRVLAWNRAPAPRMRIAPALRSEMVAMFKDDIGRLSEILGRDLSHWLDESGAIFTDVAERQTQSALPRRAAAYRSA
jgi:hypothetical protein